MTRAAWPGVARVLAVGVAAAAAVVGTAPLGSAAPTASAVQARLSAAAAAAAGSVHAADQPEIASDPIPYGATRRAQMARYAQRHYGSRTARLTDVRQIVLHFTVTSGYRPVWNTFAANTAAKGTTGAPEKPGTCAHFVIDTDGTIHQLVSLRWMCRHAVGLNDQSIGIEFVEPHSAANILKRPAQVGAGVRLVRWLQSEYGVADKDVIGHSMVNRSRFFTDRRGWRNTHVDWSAAQVRQFRALL